MQQQQQQQEEQPELHCNHSRRPSSAPFSAAWVRHQPASNQRLLRHCKDGLGVSQPPRGHQLLCSRT
jgi:hypothetical protein